MRRHNLYTFMLCHSEHRSQIINVWLKWIVYSILCLIFLSYDENRGVSICTKNKNNVWRIEVIHFCSF
jgi:hypothetical protein